MNSFIQFNDYGGYVEISYSVFDSFSTCGAVIRNKYLRYQLGQTPSDFPTYYNVRANNLQHEVYERLYPTMTNVFTSCDPCFGIDITETTFSNFGYLKTSSSAPIIVDPSYKMQHIGMVIDLDFF